MKKNKLFLLSIWMSLLVIQVLFSPKQTLASSFAEIQSDNTWKYSRHLEGWWHSTSFNDDHWGYVVSPSNGICGSDLIPSPQIATPMWAPNPKERETVFFRKSFDLDELPEKAILKTVFDDDGEIYVNGQLVRKDISGLVEYEPFEDDVLPFLQEGRNVIGLMVSDNFGGCQSAQVKTQLNIEYEGDILDVALFKQNDGKWKKDVYAGGSLDNLDCGETLEDCGCVTTSLAMMLDYYGLKVTPAELNEYFKKDQTCGETGCVSLGYRFGYVRWSAIDQFTKERHDQLGTDKIQLVQRSLYDEDLVRIDLLDEKPVVLQAKDGSHWFLGRGTTDESIVINDPYFDRNLLDHESYENTALGMARYEKTNSDFSLIEVATPVGASIILTDRYGNRAGYDEKSGEVLTEIPGSSFHIEKPIQNPNINVLPVSKGLNVITILRPQPSRYTIDVVGDTQYEVSLYTSTIDSDVQHKLISGESTKENAVDYEFAYSPDKTILFEENNTSNNVTPTPTPNVFLTPTIEPTPEIHKTDITILMPTLPVVVASAQSKRDEKIVEHEKHHYYRNVCRKEVKLVKDEKMCRKKEVVTKSPIKITMRNKLKMIYEILIGN